MALTQESFALSVGLKNFNATPTNIQKIKRTKQVKHTKREPRKETPNIIPKQQDSLLRVVQNERTPAPIHISHPQTASLPAPRHLPRAEAQPPPPELPRKLPPTRGMLGSPPIRNTLHPNQKKPLPTQQNPRSLSNPFLGTSNPSPPPLPPPPPPQQAQPPPTAFVTAREQLVRDEAQNKRGLSSNTPTTRPNPSANRQFAQGRQQTPIHSEPEEIPSYYGGSLPNLGKPSGLSRNPSSLSNRSSAGKKKEEGLASLPPELLGGLDPNDERLQALDPKLVETVLHDLMDHKPKVDWEDIAGLADAKASIMEEVIWPMSRPELFNGLRATAKGVLLFGPPGTGKTMIGKAIASLSDSTFFSVSASSLMSKWVGEGEKMVRTLFTVAGCFPHAIVFIDEIDSLLTARTEGDAEASRRVKTEFLVQLDGVGTSQREKVLIIGATNRPQELDEAARRRMTCRLYIPLPDTPARLELVSKLLNKNTHALSREELEDIAAMTKGYSGSDIHALCTNAARGPLREIMAESRNIHDIDPSSIRPIGMKDFTSAFRQVRPSVDQKDLQLLVDWNNQYGSFSAKEEALRENQD
ncbi:putative Vacuolar protein sorting-associated protein 4 [Blattamonas nauphoetae]|uniref:Vacuolar protein sorting-associated protein 4 n=1 Tax=Blattamonas nauphoetae TaxID=2049346 RepID=A0ABQ9WRG1_9EUKA|nr:putative Vacuolar protein sorting-associated protein 4 [Blattamonas nauphoetae]